MSIASGGFAQPNDYTAGIVATTAASGDFDGDGLPDVVLCDGSNLAFFINQGNGFKTPVVIAQACGSLAVGDFNGDALADVATASGLQRAAYVIMNTTH